MLHAAAGTDEVLAGAPPMGIDLSPEPDGIRADKCQKAQKLPP